jgi:hypothetical protein
VREEEQEMFRLALDKLPGEGRGTYAPVIGPKRFVYETPSDPIAIQNPAWFEKRYFRYCRVAALYEDCVEKVARGSECSVSWKTSIDGSDSS